MSRLTQTDIDEYLQKEKAAQEFDARVATKIFRAEAVQENGFLVHDINWYINQNYSDRPGSRRVHMSVALGLSGVDHRSGSLPFFSKSAAADLAVLREVQNNWLEGRQLEFANALKGIYQRRAQRVQMDIYAPDALLFTLYEVGDYSKAALIVIPDD